MKRDSKVFLDYVIQASEEIREYTAGMDLSAYRKSRVRRRSVERCFTIIGYFQLDIGTFSNFYSNH